MCQMIDPHLGADLFGNQLICIKYYLRYSNNVVTLYAFLYFHKFKTYNQISWGRFTQVTRLDIGEVYFQSGELT